MEILLHRCSHRVGFFNPSNISDEVFSRSLSDMFGKLSFGSYTKFLIARILVLLHDSRQVVFFAFEIFEKICRLESCFLGAGV
jgi:hypothetical protein